MRSLFLVIVAGILAIPALGCGGGARNPDDVFPKPVDYGGPEGDKLAAMMAEFNESKHDLTMLNVHFVTPLKATGSGKNSGKARGYEKYTYMIDGKVTVTGDTATARIIMTNESSEGEPVIKEWKFLRKGDVWKVQTAVLP